LYIFFVVSGFIIPYSMRAAGFEWRSFGRFICKRMLRLDPPYIVAVMLCLVLLKVSAVMPGFRGHPLVFSWGQFFAHFGYLNDLVGYSWYAHAFWTLAIEFQWYLVVALVFPLFVHRQVGWRWLVLGVFLILAWLFKSDTKVFHYLPLFGLGVAAFFLQASLVCRWQYWVLLAGLGAVCESTMESGAGLVAVGTALVICFGQWRQRWLLWLGKLSYSIYLVHVPVGGRIISLGTRLPNQWGVQCVVRAGAVAVTIGTAYLLWRFVEKPAVKWAAKISLKRAVDPRA
jgi:peptidoglycan/LPS O-acetylase OafA/YrhL